MIRKMTALVIGNSKYPENELKNPVNDAIDITKKLKDFGFFVDSLTDATNEQIDRALLSFKGNLNSNDVGLFYFAGHGIQIEMVNYLIPIDVNYENEISVKHSSCPLDKVIDTMAKASNQTNIIILDACRSNPFERAWSRSFSVRGLAPVYAPKGTIIGFATSPGEVAFDGNGRNGSYTESLLCHIATPDIHIEEMFKRVRNTLAVLTNNRQTSWEHTSLQGDFFFNLSFINTVGLYSKEAIADYFFVVDETKPLHGLINKLKSRDWYIQNPAIRDLDSEAINSADKDSVFVVGRNIYQSACGSSDGAISFIRRYRDRTRDVVSGLRTSLLNGIIFEIFFNRKGDLRKQCKTSYFNEVFSLSQYSEFSDSFTFIADLLSIYSNRFYSVPGKGNTTTLNIVGEQNTHHEYQVKAVYYAGNNILKLSPYYALCDSDHAVSYESLIKDTFERKLSEEMLVPKDKLNVIYDISLQNEHNILFPIQYTVSL